jgi:signal transduction histidine kinase
MDNALSHWPKTQSQSAAINQQQSSTNTIAMRSIRRSMTVYLFALLAITLAVVWVVIDQVTARALAAREAAGADLIRARYEERAREEKLRTDKALLDQARLLGNIMGQRYVTRFNEEFIKYRIHMTASPLMFVSNPLAETAWTMGFDHPGPFGKPNPGPGLLFRMYFANLPIPDDYVAHFDDEGHGDDYFQINTVAGREWRSRSLGAHKLPFDHKEIDKTVDPTKPDEPTNTIDWVYGETTIDGERVRKVLYKMPHYNGSVQFGPRGGSRPGGPGGPGGPPGPGREDRKDDRPPPPPGGSGFGPPARSLVGAWTAWALSGFGGPPPIAFGVGPPTPPVVLQIPNPDSLPRLYVQCARPQAAIDAVLAQFAAERDEELARLVSEIRDARTTLRLQVTMIALGAFLALAVGGPVLVGRGLRPVGKLSDAVSRVSEKDFKLPHDGTDLAVELAPIHARLTQTLDLLQRAFSREKQAVADISHELRTPIAALLATIDVSLRKPRSPEQYRSTLEECRLISKQLSQLVERIMTLASLDAGNDHMLVARTDASELVSDCAAVIRPLAAAKGIGVEVRTDDAIELDTDSGKLREVLMNLLHNAVEYNKPSGSIELVTRRENDSAVFEVRDTGIGMTPEVKDKIFERFFRADPSRHSTGVHAGLGLAIVKEYVSRLNGTIVVESVAGEGSTFRVALPIPLAPPTAPASDPVHAVVS